MGTRAIETRRRSKQRRQEAQPYDEATRTCTDEVRGHQQKRRSETTALREAVRHRQAVRGACPTAMDLLDLHVHRLQKKQPAGPTAKRKQQQT